MNFLIEAVETIGAWETIITLGPIALVFLLGCLLACILPD